MALAATAKYEQFVLEVEFTTGTWSRICGITDITINRTSQIDTTEVPDCDDESLPLAIERQVRSQEVTVSGTGVYAQSSAKRLIEWQKSGATQPTRIRNLKALADGVPGDIVAETGPAILVNLNNTRTKGQKVTAEIEIQFDGVPTLTLKT